MIYFLLAILTLIGVYRYDYCDNNHTQNRRIYLIFLCILYICVAGLRYRLGQDTLGYLADYEKLKPISIISGSDFERTRFAPGFVVLTSIFKQFTPDFTFFQFFHAAVVNSILFYFFNKYSKHAFFAILIFLFYQYFWFSFQQMREALAVCVFLMAWPFFRDGKWIWWYAASFLAFSFHLSALIMFFLPLICVPGIKQLFVFGKRTWIICIGVAIAAYAVQSVFFKYIELIAMSESLIERAQTYQKSDLGGGTLNLNGLVAHFFKFIIFPIASMYFLRKTSGYGIRKQFDKLYAFVLMSVYISIVVVFIAIFQRYNNYFFPFATLIMSDWVFGYLYSHKKKIRLNFATWMIIFLPMFGFFFYTYTQNMNKSGTLKEYMVYYPYRSVLDKTENQTTEKALMYKHRNY